MAMPIHMAEMMFGFGIPGLDLRYPGREGNPLRPLPPRPEGSALEHQLTPQIAGRKGKGTRKSRRQ